MFADANTPCPACRQPVPLPATTCPHCQAPADTSSAFLSFRRPNGSAGMIDQTTAAFLRSPLGRPRRQDLTNLFATSTRIQLAELVFENERGTFRPSLAFTDPADRAALHAALLFHKRSYGHLMTFGNWRLDFFREDTPIAQIDLVALSFLRWPDRWKSDVALIDPRALANFFESRGQPALRLSLDEAEQSARAREPL